MARLFHNRRFLPQQHPFPTSSGRSDTSTLFSRKCPTLTEPGKGLRPGLPPPDTKHVAARPTSGRHPLCVCVSLPDRKSPRSRNCMLLITESTQHPARGLVRVCTQQHRALASESTAGQVREHPGPALRWDFRVCLQISPFSQTAQWGMPK